MPAPSPVAQQRAMSSLSALSRRDLAILWPKLNLNKPAKLAEPLSEIVSLIVAKYGLATASLAADVYDESRVVANAPGRFTAITAPVPEVSKVDVLSRWAVGPLFGANPDGALALSLVGGGLQRMVADMGRDTTAMSVAADPSRPSYARHASANACAFCAMLAARGPIYGKGSAVAVTGESLGGKDYRYMRRDGRSFASTVASRASRSSLKRPIGEKYHDDCRCTAIAVWSGQKYTPAPYVKKWQDAYDDAHNTGDTLKQTLAHMRETLGTN